MKPSFSGRSLLAAVLAMSAGIGFGSAAPITGLNHKAVPTPKAQSSRSRSRRGNYGKNLLAAFERKGICHSAKKNKLRKTYGQHYA